MKFGRVFAAVAAFAVLLVMTSVVSPMPAQARTSVYDSQMERRIKVNGSKRRQFLRVLRASRKQRNAIFRKYKINPFAKPDFSKLQQASGELLALSSWERQQMKNILTTEQMARYDAIIRQTRARVMKAAQ